MNIDYLIRAVFSTLVFSYYCGESLGQYYHDWENGKIVDASVVAPPPAEDGGSLIAEIMNKSESSELIALHPMTLRLMKISDPGLYAKSSAYESLYDRPILKIYPITLQGKKDLLASLAAGAEGINHYSFRPTFAIRCFHGFNCELILVSTQDSQVRILTGKSDKLYIVSRRFCDTVARLSLNPSECGDKCTGPLRAP